MYNIGNKKLDSQESLPDCPQINLAFTARLADFLTEDGDGNALSVCMEAVARHALS
mgnify:CR=1 FL=1